MKIKPMPIIAVAIWVIPLVWIFWGRSLVERIRFYHFEPEEWKSASEEERYYMAKYLVDQEILLGKTPEEVIALLGPSDNGHPVMYLYKLGPERGSWVHIDSDWLAVSFMGRYDNLRVERAVIRPD